MGACREAHPVIGFIVEHLREIGLDDAELDALLQETARPVVAAAL